MKEDLLKIINNYGEKKQLKKLTEEIYEFQEAVLTDTGSSESLEHITEEFADCMVILEQFKAQFDLDNDLIIMVMKEKIARQIRRIKNEEANNSPR